MQSTQLAEYYFQHLKDCADVNVGPSIKLRYIDTVTQEDELPRARFKEPCTIEVRNQDAIEATLSVLNSSSNPPAVLNLCSPTRPGGGVKVGSRAQEEELFRRTAYHKTLLVDMYPLQDDELVYSPSVPIVRTRDYEWLEHHPTASFIACAGLEWPRVREGQYFELQDEKECTRRKIRLILHTAYLHGHTTLVLGALGAGCFRGPPRGIAELFRDEIYRYRFCFQTVIFAILAHDIEDGHGPLGQVFHDVLLQKDRVAGSASSHSR
jgi:uncharacterized protein (TIGR02452 family)